MCVLYILQDQNIESALQRRVVKWDPHRYLARGLTCLFSYFSTPSLLSYYEYNWQRNKGVSFVSLFQGMPISLQADISLSLYKGIIDQVWYCDWCVWWKICGFFCKFDSVCKANLHKLVAKSLTMCKAQHTYIILYIIYAHFFRCRFSRTPRLDSQSCWLWP